MKKRSISFLFAIVIIYSIITIMPLKANATSFPDSSVEPANYSQGVSTTSELTERLNALMSKYKNTYWTASGNACSSHGNTCYSRYYYGWQCKGFASYIFNDLFCGGYIGSYDSGCYYIPNPNNAYLVAKTKDISSTDTTSVKNILSQAKPGDFIQAHRRGKTYGHSMIVISVDSSGVNIFDCNSDGKCGVKTYYQTWATFASKNDDFSLYHSTKYPQNSSCSCSTTYAGTYICTTSSANLTIRSGHGTSYSAIGSIPPGASVTISKASGTSSSDWAHVTYNGVSGYASMGYLQKQGVQHAQYPTIHLWVSDSEYGSSSITKTIGNRYYLCYELRDQNTGSLWNDVTSNTYSVTIGFFKPDGTEVYSSSFDNDDESWISYFFDTPGEYTMKYSVSGDFTGSGSKTFTVADDPKLIFCSDDSVDLTIGGTDQTTLYVWTEGYYSGSYVLNWSRSNSNVSCSWGDWSNGKCPLTISANKIGNSTVTLSVKDEDTGDILHSITVYVTVTAKTYTVSYNSNGGSGAPSSQTKYHNTNLTLSNTIPTRAGYTFLGWSTSSAATNAAYQAGAAYSSNSSVTLYAVWKTNTTSLIVNTTNNTIVSSCGEVKYFTYTPTTSAKYVIYSTGTYDTKVYLYNSNWTELTNDDDSGDTRNFRLEYTLTAGNTYIFGIKYYDATKTGTITFKFGNVFSISYDSNGGTGTPPTQSQDYGASITLSDITPTRTGHTFLGWSTSSSATSASYLPGSSYSNRVNTTFYAVWKIGCENNNHNYAYSLVNAPTTSSSGALLGKCSKCNGTTTIILPNLNTTDYNCSIITHSTCSSNGSAQYVWKNTTYGTHRFNVILNKANHSYEAVATSPTCTAQGYTTYTCSVCGDSYKDSLVSSSGHSFADEWTVDKQPTATEFGIKSRHCVNCSAITDVIKFIDSSLIFTDVKAGKWYTPAVDYVVQNGLMNGVGDGTRFDPNGSMTRAMVVTVLYRLEGSPEVSGVTPFTDLKSNWYKNAVTWAYKTGVVTGTSVSTFTPDGNVTREQIATILYRYANYKGYSISATADLGAFPDASTTGNWAKTALEWAYSEGLITGAAKNGQTVLDPKGEASRAQVATILMRFCEKH